MAVDGKIDKMALEPTSALPPHQHWHSSDSNDPEELSTTKGSSLWAYLNAEVDPAMATMPLAAFSFMTGFMYVIFRFLK